MMVLEQCLQIFEKLGTYHYNIGISFNMFVGTIEALSDIWVIGDTFFKDNYMMLQGLKAQALMMK